MFKRSGTILLAAGIGSAVLALAGPASAVPATTVAATAVPSPTCKVPSMTVTPDAGTAGTRIQVSGLNFSGCPLKVGTPKPTAVLKVEVGLLDPATKKTVVLATVNTTATGAFSTSFTLPSVTGTNGAAPKIEVAAAAEDPTTKLKYFFVEPFSYTAAAGTEVPTAVPAGSGGQAGTTSASSELTQGGIGAAGLLLIAGAGVALRRRHSGTHS